jgi:hypothetical protein
MGETKPNQTNKPKKADRRTTIELTSWAWENQGRLHGLTIEELERRAHEALPHRFSTEDLIRVLSVVGVKPTAKGTKS